MSFASPKHRVNQTRPSASISREPHAKPSGNYKTRMFLQPEDASMLKVTPSFCKTNIMTVTAKTTKRVSATSPRASKLSRPAKSVPQHMRPGRLPRKDMWGSSKKKKNVPSLAPTVGGNLDERDALKFIEGVKRADAGLGSAKKLQATLRDYETGKQKLFDCIDHDAVVAYQEAQLAIKKKKNSKRRKKTYH